MTALTHKTHKFDVLVIGAGVIGSAVSMSLAQRGVKSIALVDLDLSGEWSSSELNAGGVRATWSQPENLLASKKSIEYFAGVAEQVGYRAVGYLWLHRPDRWEPALRAREMHVAQGWPVEVWDVPQLKAKVPFIDKTDDLAGALFGVKDGLVNPNRLKEHYREEATLRGTTLFDGVFVQSTRSVGTRTIVRAFQFHAGASMPSALKKRLLVEDWSSEHESLGQWIEFDVGTIVNCAGAWAGKVAPRLGYQALCQPVRRQISLFHARDVDLSHYGMMIDPSGVYFHPEAIYGLSGFATADEPAGYNFNYDAESFFESYIWPALYERSSAFESLKHISGWAGLYENSPDHHAIVGEVARQGAEATGARIFEAHSFSGHGVMQSYAVGEGLSELICKGRYESIDMTAWSSTRFKSGTTFAPETWVI